MNAKISRAGAESLLPVALEKEKAGDCGKAGSTTCGEAGGSRAGAGFDELKGIRGMLVVRAGSPDTREFCGCRPTNQRRCEFGARTSSERFVARIHIPESQADEVRFISAPH